MCLLRRQGVIIAFDSNYRPALWENAGIARAAWTVSIVTGLCPCCSATDSAGSPSIRFQLTEVVARDMGAAITDR